MYKCIHGLAHHTLRHAVSRHHTAPAVPTSGPPTCNSCRFHERRHAMAIGVSWSTVPLCGTVCQLRYVHRTRHWTYLKINWKLSSSELSTEWVIADAANLRGINHLIIIIIIVLLATETKQLTSPQFQQRTLSSRSWASFCLNVAVAWQRLPSLEWTLTLGLMDFRHQLVWLNPLFPRHSTPLHATPLDNCHSAHRPLSMTVLTWIYSVHNKNKT